MSKNSSSSGGGIGFMGLLTIVFITLKLTGTINWSWLWVLSPIWAGIALVVAIFLILFVAAFVHDAKRNRALKERMKRYRERNQK